jgi:hypothetical protein
MSLKICLPLEPSIHAWRRTFERINPRNIVVGIENGFDFMTRPSQLLETNPTVSIEKNPQDRMLSGGCELQIHETQPEISGDRLDPLRHSVDKFAFTHLLFHGSCDPFGRSTQP